MLSQTEQEIHFESKNQGPTIVRVSGSHSQELIRTKPLKSGLKRTLCNRIFLSTLVTRVPEYTTCPTCLTVITDGRRKQDWIFDTEGDDENG